MDTSSQTHRQSSWQQDGQQRDGQQDDRQRDGRRQDGRRQDEQWDGQRDEPREQPTAVDRSPSDIPISIDTSCGIPLWLQLRNRLTYLITSGHFRCGDRLPTVRNLAVDLGINFNTVSKVYRDIERDGYIVSRQGAGTFVSDEYRHREGAALKEVDLLIDEFVRECLELGVPKDDIAGLVIERLMIRDDAKDGGRR